MTATPGQAHADTVFSNLAEALATAAAQNRVQVTPAVTGLQACYYVGAETPPADAPANLLCATVEGFAQLVATTSARPPSRVTTHAALGPPEARKAYLAEISRGVQQGLQLRTKAAYEATQRYTRRQPRPFEGRLRVFVPASRETTVMQFSARDVARAFERLGHEVRFLIEERETDRMDARRLVEELERFDPHLLFSVNHLQRMLVPPDVVTATWWQDLMPPLQRRAPLGWRPNDLCYAAAHNVLAEPLLATGLPGDQLRIQTFCVDGEVFDEGAGGPREEKVVFVGSAAAGRMRGDEAERRLVRTLTRRLTEGALLDEPQVRALAAEEGVDPWHAYHDVFYAVMRDEPVRWLCRLPGVRVEVYGRYWERDPEVAPFFKGELPHGRPLADAYRSARYALVLHPIEINTQRMAEAASCGCIPVAYDCRPIAAPPHWDDRVLYFRTPAELAERLAERPQTHAAEFRRFFSYERFAERILADAAPHLPRA